MWNLAGEMDQKSRVTLKEKGMTINAVTKLLEKSSMKLALNYAKSWSVKAGQDAQTILSDYNRIAQQ